MNIKPTVQRKANGWAAVLEFPNGGRQVFSQRFGTLKEAQREAEKLKRVRLTYPNCTIPDPQPNQCQEIGDHTPFSKVTDLNVFHQ